MKLHNLLTAFFIFSLTAITAGCDNKGAQKSEVVYIDVAKAIIDSPLATQEKARLDQVRKILINAGDDAAKNYKGMRKAPWFDVSAKTATRSVQFHCLSQGYKKLRCGWPRRRGEKRRRQRFHPVP